MYEDLRTKVTNLSIPKLPDVCKDRLVGKLWWLSRSYNSNNKSIFILVIVLDLDNKTKYKLSLWSFGVPWHGNLTWADMIRKKFKQKCFNILYPVRMHCWCNIGLIFKKKVIDLSIVIYNTIWIIYAFISLINQYLYKAPNSLTPSLEYIHNVK